MEPVSNFMHPDRDRVISFIRDGEGRVSFHILNRIDPLEFEGLQKVYWRKILPLRRLPERGCRFRSRPSAIRLGRTGLVGRAANLSFTLRRSIFPARGAPLFPRTD
jgi:hypothetical protein